MGQVTDVLLLLAAVPAPGDRQAERAEAAHLLGCHGGARGASRGLPDAHQVLGLRQGLPRALGRLPQGGPRRHALAQPHQEPADGGLDRPVQVAAGHDGPRAHGQDDDAPGRRGEPDGQAVPPGRVQALPAGRRARGAAVDQEPHDHAAGHQATALVDQAVDQRAGAQAQARHRHPGRPAAQGRGQRRPPPDAHPQLAGGERGRRALRPRPGPARARGLPSGRQHGVGEAQRAQGARQEGHRRQGEGDGAARRAAAAPRLGYATTAVSPCQPLHCL